VASVTLQVFNADGRFSCPVDARITNRTDSVGRVSGAGGPDGLRARRLSAGETAAWYALAAVTYIGAAILEKGLLNWLIGPAWLVAVITFGPAALDRVRRRR